MIKSKLWLLMLMVVGVGVQANAQLTGEKLLKKSIKYHDPKGNWEKSEFMLGLKQTTPNRPESFTLVKFDLANGKFGYEKTYQDSISVWHQIEDDKCSYTTIDDKPISEAQLQALKIKDKRTKMFRDYYTYLYGLPMKLKDEGTIIHNEVKTTDFQGQSYYEMKVTYTEAVGKDTWYFYFDQSTYALRGYRFYHDESKNDGEYITLEGEYTIKNIKFPKKRAWYMNKDDKYLGTDDIVPIQGILADDK